MYILVMLSIVYGTTAETKGLAVSSSISAVGGFASLGACQAAGQRLLSSPRPPNLELRFSCEVAE
jgi:phosphate/sulfate permease